jgi:histone acetyltransferase (RNA polymerase elongator complex component)
MAKTHAVIPFFIPNAGCPNICVFCDQRRSTGTAAIPDSASIAEKIKLYLSTMPASVKTVETAFYGGSFTAIDESLQEKLLSAVLPFRYSGVISSVRLSTRPDCIDRRVLDRLKKYMVTTIEIGAQSFNDGVLKQSGRGHTSDATIKACRMIQDAGFELVIQLMPGLPGDTKELSINSAEQASALNPSAARIYPTVVLKGTLLETMLVKNLYKPLTMNEAVSTTASMVKIFNSAGIPVIRTGIHPLSPEEASGIIGGPYHPSFGFLVKSELRLDEIRFALESLRSTGSLRGGTLLMPLHNREEYTGYGRENIVYLERELAAAGTAIKFSDVDSITYIKS